MAKQEEESFAVGDYVTSVYAELKGVVGQIKRMSGPFAFVLWENREAPLAYGTVVLRLAKD